MNLSANSFRTTIPISPSPLNRPALVQRPVLFSATSAGKKQTDSQTVKILKKGIKEVGDFISFAFAAVMIGYGVASCSVLGLLVNDYLNSENKQEISQSYEPKESQDIAELIERMEKK